MQGHDVVDTGSRAGIPKEAWAAIGVIGAALVSGVENMPSVRRSVVISGAGDRRDEDIRAQTRILGDAFDDEHAAQLTTRALRYSKLAHELHAGARRWREGSLV